MGGSGRRSCATRTFVKKTDQSFLRALCGGQRKWTAMDVVGGAGAVPAPKTPFCGGLRTVANYMDGHAHCHLCRCALPVGPGHGAAGCNECQYDLCASCLELPVHEWGDDPVGHLAVVAERVRGEHATLAKYAPHAIFYDDLVALLGLTKASFDALAAILGSAKTGTRAKRVDSMCRTVAARVCGRDPEAVRVLLVSKLQEIGAGAARAILSNAPPTMDATRYELQLTAAPRSASAPDEESGRHQFLHMHHSALATEAGQHRRLLGVRGNLHGAMRDILAELDRGRTQYVDKLNGWCDMFDAVVQWPDAAAGACPGGHVLVEHTVPPKQSNSCNGCARSFGEGSPMHRCHECDWDVCPDCWDAKWCPGGPWVSSVDLARVLLDGPVQVRHSQKLYT
jgi:hypothetical protein